METYPLKSLSIEDAMKYQFRLVDEISKHFNGMKILECGDLGVTLELNKPKTTAMVEQVIASFFHAEKAILVRGAGTGALRYACYASFKHGDFIMVHKACIYTTTKMTFDMMNIHVVEVDFNNIEEVKFILHEHPEINGALIQHTRQKINDLYDLEEVIYAIKSQRDIPIITDDNYAALKVDKIGCECGSDLACFSAFKLLGPEGIGCIVGKASYIDKLILCHYSGGMQTQGWEALEVLRGLVYAPVALAIQAGVIEQVHKQLLSGEIKEIKSAYIANAQSKVLLVEFHKPIAKAVLIEAEKLGAAPYPIGCESKYEMVPLFYRISGTFREQDPLMQERMIRINPLRSGPDTILRILKEAIAKVISCS